MPAGPGGAGRRHQGQEADRGDARDRRPLLLRLPPPLQGPDHVGGDLALRDTGPHQPGALLQHSLLLSPDVLHQLRHQPHPLQHHVLQVGSGGGGGGDVINDSDFSSQNLPDVDVLICLFPDSETGSAECSDVGKIFCSKERDPLRKVTLPLRGED